MQSREAERIRDEISSLGGMHSLLGLFRYERATQELRVIVALAVAYLLPSCLGPNTLPSPSTGLKIIECLRFLFSSMPVTSRGEAISGVEILHVSVMGVYTFWFSALSPSLKIAASKKTKVGPFNERTRKSRVIQQHAGETIFDQRREVLELQELLELTVSFIVEMARQVTKMEISHQNHHSHPNVVSLGAIVQQMCALVQHMCAMDMARPVAVREGFLKVLVIWLQSQDSEKVCAAALSVSELAATLDSYVAGWIHTLIVNEGVLSEIVQLSVSDKVVHDVRIAIAETLCSLCRAPHIRAAVVEAKCIHGLISFLYEFGDPSSQEVALAGGSALLQIVTGAMTRASVFNTDGFKLHESVFPDKQDDVIR